MNKKTLMKFYGDWCGPCKILDGVMKNIDRNARQAPYFWRVMR